MTSAPYVAGADSRRATPKKTPGVRQRHGLNCSGVANCSCPWQAYIHDPATGKPITKTFTTRSEAKLWRSDAAVALRRGEITSLRAPTVNKALADLLAGMKSGLILNRSGRPYKPGTIRAYEYAVRDVLTPKLGHLRLDEVRRRDVQNVVDELRESGISASYLRNNIDPLRVMYRRALRDDIVVRTPVRDLDLPAIERKPRDIPHPALIEVLIAALPEEDRALWTTAFLAGLRRGELRALRCDDIDLEAGIIHIVHGWDDVEGEQAPKTAKSVRDVPILRQLRPVLVAHMLKNGRRGTDLVFGRTATVPFSTSSIDRRSRKAWTDAGLPLQQLHSGRHTLVSYMAAADVPIADAQAVAGHADRRTTEDIYTHTIPGATAAVGETLSQFLDEQTAKEA